MSKHTSPLVTVAISAYNYGQFLQEAIESVLGQTYSNIELLVLDDGSTDNTTEVVKPYLKEITYMRHDNVGLPANRNIGLAAAKGVYWLALDADDTLAKDHIAQTVRYLEENPNHSFVYTQVRYFGDFAQISDVPPFNVEVLKTHNYISATSLTRTAAAQQVGYDEQFKEGWEDWDFYLSLASKGHKGGRIRKPLLNYRQHGSSREDAVNEDVLHLKLLNKLLIKHVDFYTKQEQQLCKEYWRAEVVQHVIAQRRKKPKFTKRLQHMQLLIAARAGLRQSAYQLFFVVSPSLYEHVRKGVGHA